MSIKDRPVLKTYFETGDVPTEAQFIDLIDSAAILSGNNASVGDWGITGNITVNGTISATTISATQIDITEYEISGFNVNGGDITVNGGDVVITSVGSLVSGIPSWDATTDTVDNNNWLTQDTANPLYVNVSGDAMTGDLSLGGNTITNLKRTTQLVSASAVLTEAQSNTLIVLTAADLGNIQFNLPAGSWNNIGMTFSFTKIASGTKVILQPDAANQIEDSALGATLYSGNSSVALSAGQQQFASVDLTLCTPTIWHIDNGRKTWTSTEFV